jgi:pimeloyl-ACP methyl ester carboxylesterase
MRGIYKSEAGRQAVETFYRNVLQHWPVANEQITVATRHGETFVIACGPVDAPPLVLLHGSGSNSAVWFRDVIEWARRHRVYAVDIIGEPGLSAPCRPRLRCDIYAEWLHDVWQRLELERASVVAVSLGGWMALAYAVTRPTRVASLSLLSPAGIGARKASFVLKAAVMLMAGKGGVARALSAASGRKTPVAAPVAQYVTLIFENFRPRRQAPPLFSDADLLRLSMPVQVVVGANDAMLHARHTRDRVTRLLPRAEVACIEGAGHMLPPQTGAIADFLSRTWAAPANVRAAAASAI